MQEHEGVAAGLLGDDAWVLTCWVVIIEGCEIVSLSLGQAAGCRAKFKTRCDDCPDALASGLASGFMLTHSRRWLAGDQRCSSWQGGSCAAACSGGDPSHRLKIAAPFLQRQTVMNSVICAVIYSFT